MRHQKQKKTRKLRGHVSHGYGRVGKHRKHSGGRGKCGGLKHLRTLFQKYHPDHFMKHGKRFHNSMNNRRWSPEINVKDIWSLLPAEDLSNCRTEEAVSPVIDLSKYGYAKLLCRGEIRYKRPVVVKARAFTKAAEEAIVSMGGQCILTA